MPTLFDACHAHLVSSDGAPFADILDAIHGEEPVARPPLRTDVLNIVKEMFGGDDYLLQTDVRKNLLVAIHDVLDTKSNGVYGDGLAADILEYVGDDAEDDLEIAAAILAILLRPVSGQGNPSPWCRVAAEAPDLLYITGGLKRAITSNPNARVEVSGEAHVEHSRNAKGYTSKAATLLAPATGKRSVSRSEVRLAIPVRDALDNLKYRPDAVSGIRWANLLSPLANKRVECDGIIHYERSESPELGLGAAWADDVVLYDGSLALPRSGNLWDDLGFIDHPLALMRSISVPGLDDEAVMGVEYQRTKLEPIELRLKIASLWSAIMCGAFDVILWIDEDAEQAAWVAEYLGQRWRTLLRLHLSWESQYRKLSRNITGYSHGTSLKLPSSAPGLEYLQAHRDPELAQFSVLYSSHDDKWTIKEILPDGSLAEGLNQGSVPINQFDIVGQPFHVFHTDDDEDIVQLT